MGAIEVPLEEDFKKVAHLYDCWCRVQAKHSSVQSEKVQLMDKTWTAYNEEAREIYLEETTSFRFQPLLESCLGSTQVEEIHLFFLLQQNQVA
jgi:hypothetical protein